jgi:hypothetical protein
LNCVHFDVFVVNVQSFASAIVFGGNRLVPLKGKKEL